MILNALNVKIKTQLKWSPKNSFNKGILKTFLWYFDNQKYLKIFQKDIIKDWEK